MHPHPFRSVLGPALLWMGLGLALWAVAGRLERHPEVARLALGGMVFGVAVIWMGWLLVRLWLEAQLAPPPKRGEP